MLLRSSENVTQASINRIWSDCLEAMLVLYLPPHRDSDEAESEATCARALQDYIEDLVDFPSEILKAGWKDVRRTHKRLGWPLIGEIRSSCVQLQQRANRASAPVENVFDRINRKAVEINRLMLSYTDSFMLGDLGREARAEGWHIQLRDYVRGEAHLQAQRIVRTGQGSIDVMIPGDLIAEWKRF